MTVKLTAEQKIKILNSDDIYRIMQQVLLRDEKIDRGKEHLWVVAMSQSNRILFIELVSLGSPQATTAEPLDVFSFALQKQAVKILLVHNHPSGDLQPSQTDIDVTRRMISVGKLVLCEVMDHLIISEKSYWSFKDSGLYAQIETSAVDLTFKEVDKAEQLVRDQQKQHRKEKEEIAVFMLRKGIDPTEIINLTGLTKVKVAALAKAWSSRSKKAAGLIMRHSGLEPESPTGWYTLSSNASCAAHTMAKAALCTC